MGFSFGGLLAGAMKGLGEGYTAVAKGELENQQKLDYQQKFLQMQQEKDLAADAIKRDRDVEDIGRKGVATANVERDTAATKGEAAASRASSEAAARGRLGVAAQEARNAVAGDAAKIDEQIAQDVPGKTAQLARSTFDATKDLKRDEATETGGNEGRKQVGKTGVEGFTASVAQEDRAKAAGEMEVAKIRESGRTARAGGLKDMTDSWLLREADTLRKSADTARKKEDREFYGEELKKVLAEIASRREARSGGGTAPADTASAPRSGATSSSRPPLSNFNR